MRFCVVLLVAFGILLVAWMSYFYRFTTNTAGGRFYRTDRWRGVTLVVEKDGSTRNL